MLFSSKTTRSLIVLVFVVDKHGYGGENTMSVHPVSGITLSLFLCCKNHRKIAKINLLFRCAEEIESLSSNEIGYLWTVLKLIELSGLISPLEYFILIIVKYVLIKEVYHRNVKKRALVTEFYFTECDGHFSGFSYTLLQVPVPLCVELAKN